MMSCKDNHYSKTNIIQLRKLLLTKTNLLVASLSKLYLDAIYCYLKEIEELIIIPFSTQLI